MNNFRVGQKVVCIVDEKWWDFTFFPRKFPAPKKGEICTVRAILDRSDVLGGVCPVALMFAEYIFRGGFDARAFRPAVERGTERGMAILRKILEDTPVTARVFTVEILNEAIRKAKENAR